MAFYNEWSKLFGAATGNGSLKSFKEATGGVANMDTTIGSLKQNQAPVAIGANLSVEVGVPGSGILGATDPDGDVMTYSIVTQGSKGVAVVTNSATGAFTYTPNPGTSGIDSFTFKASDGRQDSAETTISVKISGGKTIYLPVVMR